MSVRATHVVLCLLWLPHFLGTEPNYGKFWHVTDFHYDHTYLTSRLSCNPKEVRGQTLTLGDPWCDAPWALVTKAINAMASSSIQVDFVLWTGDTVAHIPNDKMTLDVNMEVLENLTRALMDAFPDTPVIPTFGNHDYYPASQFPPSSCQVCNLTATIWEPWIPDQTQLENFRKGGYYTRLLPHPGNSKVRVVALNTNLYYTSNKATPNSTDPAGQLHWLSQTLLRARERGEKVMIAAHISPGIHTPRGVQWFQQDFVQPVNDILNNFSDIITAMHFGHDHFDGFKVFTGETGKAPIPLFVAPSVTPWRYRYNASDAQPPHNPSFRLVTYDRSTGDHLDIQQFSLDLKQAELNSHDAEAAFTLLYSFTRSYKIRDLSAQSLLQLMARMEGRDEGEQLLNMYYRFALAGARDTDGCDEKCKNSILCGFRHFTKQGFDKCVRRRLGGITDSSAQSTHYNYSLQIAFVVTMTFHFMIVSFALL